MDVLWLVLSILAAISFGWPVTRLIGLWTAQKKFKLPDDLVSRTLGLAQDPGLSVVIAARNEALNLPALLGAMSAQTYPGTFEVLIVDDRSTDHTPLVLQQAQTTYPWLRWLRVEQTPEGWSPKKWALTQGIEAAQYERMAFTDADCTPAPGWLEAIVAAYEQGAEVILGYAPVVSDGTKPGDLQAVEAWLQATDNLALTALNRPITATGRNLAYTKAVFRRVGGFEAHKGVLSGDDDLLVTHRKKYGLLWYLLDEDAQVTTAPKPTLPAWRKARLRHIGAARHYPLGVRVLHGLRQLSFWSGRIVRVAVFFAVLAVVLNGLPWLPLVVFSVLYETAQALAHGFTRSATSFKPLRSRSAKTLAIGKTKKSAIQAQQLEALWGIRALLAPPKDDWK